MDQYERFDITQKPRKEKFFLTPVAWLLSFPTVWRRKLKINKVGMKGLKPPYVLICTHHSFLDFKVTTKAIFPHRANYIVAIDGFIKREWLLRNVGAIEKRKFTNDTVLFRHIKYALEKLNNIVAIYPEARYSLIGTSSILPDSLGKMVKVLNKPVVVLNMHGDYLTQPVWNLKMRKVPLKADMTKLFDPEDLKTLSIDEINASIRKAMTYDEYQWQKDNHIKIDFKDRAKNIHKILYQCPSCHKEHQMDSDEHYIWCNACGKTYEMSVYGELKAQKGDTEFSHIPDWYEWQRSEVIKQLKNKTYSFSDEVIVEALPNTKGYINLGNGWLTHDSNGFSLKLKNETYDINLEKEPLSMYGCHVEYDYMHKGDCVDLSTLHDTFYIYPMHKKNVVTKIQLAVEELYILEKEKKNLT
ncbi:lysophospholipid acyltransferase family protein [Mariniplasma anaerobium]|uniref:1-acyl-sn-glycerol-3-phosphate acyltransferase n=1 Tax=Mariniplasma anaerobium TaxID=2735436 RepID=A0A7U9TJZ6_9MOLU|nr:hypothetical protein [Mariniplasma anaerobium]BCR36264.1 hypothetical protein MPAN_011570 [Mariniplasma anaerobium]